MTEMFAQKQNNQSNTTGIPNPMITEFESKSGLSYRDVRVHYPSSEPARLGALAFTKGTQVYIGPGQLQHLPHELVHVAQQKQGRTNVSSAHLEQEAEAGRLLPLPMADSPGNMLQYRRLTPEDINAILLAENRNPALIPEEDKQRICMLAGTQIRPLFLGGPIESRAKRIIDLYLQREPGPASDLLTLLETASETRAVEQTENILEGSSNEHKIVVQGGFLPLPDDCFKSVSDILSLLPPAQQSKMFKLMNRLLSVSTPKGVLSVIEGANMNISQPILIHLTVPTAEYSPEIQKDAFLQRMELMTQFIMQTAEEQIQIDGQMHIIKNLFYIESTGSDPHEGGRQALFLIPKTGGNKIVYKPRSLQTDQAVAGPQGIVTSFSKAAPSGQTNLPGLPSMPFGKVALADGTESLRCEEFLQSVGRNEEQAVEWETALRFYYQLGQLQTIAKVGGITDLHADNILFTEQGPIIIDAECSFIEYSDTLIESINGPLQRSINSSSTDLAASVFYLKTPDGKILLSTEAYSTLKLPELLEAFSSGKRMMLDYLLSRGSSQNTKAAKASLKGLDHIRLVPIATEDFGELLNDYLYYQQSSSPAYCNNLLEHTALAVHQALLNSKWLFMKEKCLYFKAEAFSLICKLLKRAFDNKTIPAFYMDKSRRVKKTEIWEIRLDGTAIAETHWSDGLDTHIASRIVQNIQNERLPTGIPISNSAVHSPLPSSAGSLQGRRAKFKSKLMSLLQNRLNYAFTFTIQYSYDTDLLSSKAEQIMLSIKDQSKIEMPWLSDSDWEASVIKTLNFKNVTQNINYAVKLLQIEHLLAIRICAYTATDKIMLSLEEAKNYIRSQGLVKDEHSHSKTPTSQLAENIFLENKENIRGHFF